MNLLHKETAKRSQFNLLTRIIVLVVLLDCIEDFVSTFPKGIAAEFKRTITLSGGRFFVVPRDFFEEYHEENESSS